MPHIGVRRGLGLCGAMLVLACCVSLGMRPERARADGATSSARDEEAKQDLPEAPTDAAKPKAASTTAKTRSAKAKAKPIVKVSPADKVVKTDAEWKKLLSRESYRVTRRHGTERAFSGKYWNSKKDGVYRCVACDLPLFDAKSKFDSGTGWPSFYEPIDPQHVGTREDYALFYRRTEVHCERCGAHLGHVFDDGPQPTGLRFCMNSVALDFVPRADFDRAMAAAEQDDDSTASAQGKSVDETAEDDATSSVDDTEATGDQHADETKEGAGEGPK